MFEQVSDSTDRNLKLWIVLAAIAFALLGSLGWILRMTPSQVHRVQMIMPAVLPQFLSCSHLERGPA
jgi:hypothetical protein